MESASLFDRSELGVQSAVEWLRLLIESMGALVIAVGILVAIALLVRSALAHRGFDFNQVRLAFARHLALALEFQLAADILSTAIAPSWDRIGKLAAIAIIRTALNYFLMLELRNETARSKQATGSDLGEAHGMALER
jgi:uncharacterized membrane protein